MVSHALSWVVSVLYDRCAIRMPVTRKQDLRGLNIPRPSTVASVVEDLIAI